MDASYKLDTIIKVDKSLCIKCDACIRCCPGPVITKGPKDEFPVPTADSWKLCIDCGHCVAICPSGALQQRAMGPEDCEPIDMHLVPRWDQVRQLMTTRRAIRGYVYNKQVEKEKILQLLTVASHAPNGGNRLQAWAPKDERTATPAAWIATAHIQLAATTLGLGTAFCEAIGFASRAYPPPLELFGRPEGEVPYASFLIGYPTEFYHRIPKKKPIDVTWF